MRSHGLVVAEDAHREVLHVGGPLSRKLEKLHIVPLKSVNRHWTATTQRTEHRVNVLFFVFFSQLKPHIYSTVCFTKATQKTLSIY